MLLLSEVIVPAYQFVQLRGVRLALSVRVFQLVLQHGYYALVLRDFLVRMASGLRPVVERG